MTPILEGNTGSSNTLPGPVRYITCQAGQVIVIDPTEKPPVCTVLNPDDVYEGEGKAGLRIYDVDGSRLYWESTLEGENRTDPQLVTAPDARPQTDPRGEPLETSEVRGDADPTDDKATGSYESRSKADLYELAKERDLDVTSHDSKADLIAALRGE
jgi:hypothetical protein